MSRANLVIVQITLSFSLAAVVCLSNIERGTIPTALAAATPGREPATIEVGMWTLWHDREVRLDPAGPNRTISMQTCAQCAMLALTRPAIIRANGDTLSFSGAAKSGTMNRTTLNGPATLTAHDETVTISSPITITSRAGILVFTVTLPVESYVERVVASESGPADSQPSLQALAIVVRTFALHEPHGHKDYDLCDSTHCQLLHWGGNPSRQVAAHAATLSTAGETLWFHGARALAYVNKDCGGHTASPTEIWPRARALVYLPSQPDRFCTSSDSKAWASELSHAELTAALASAGIATPGWQHLTVERRGESGRAVTLRLDATLISAESFQLVIGQSLGWSRIPSTWFEVSQQGDRFHFHGRGWGHGVGLCQKGAATMATQGRSTSQILQQYFPGAQAADEATGRSWQTFAGAGFTLESLNAEDVTYLPQLSRARAEASQRSGLEMSATVTVRAFASTPAFRNATLAPGWVAAFTEGPWIATQPFRTLATRGELDSILLHEFLHALVEHQAGPQTPLWLREGLVEAWSKPATQRNRLAPSISPDQVARSLAHASTEAESESAHRAAGFYAQRLLDRYGRNQVLVWLRSGLPDNVLAALRQP